MELTQEMVKEAFDYHEDGYLIWKINIRYQRPKINARAGYLDKAHNGLRYRITIAGKDYLQSRIIFLWHKGYLPVYVDHKDRNRLNDRIDNLRECTASENNKNRKSHKHGASKYLGVYISTNRKKWIASITYGGKQRILGRFDNEEIAASTYNEAAKIHHGEFANLNIIERQ